ncbi:unnamed protein product, partial [Rotaria magnacalcarata]
VIYLTYAYESPIGEKDFKKLLKQNKNVLVLWAPNGNEYFILFCFS